MLTIERPRSREELDLLFGSLADPIRRDIIERLALKEATVSELAAPYAISLPAVSRHLKVLERASLITVSRDGRWRSARLAPSALAAAAAWIVHSERLWAERFGRLDEHLARAVEKVGRANYSPCDDADADGGGA